MPSDAGAVRRGFALLRGFFRSDRRGGPGSLASGEGEPSNRSRLMILKRQVEESVEVPLGALRLEGTLDIPNQPHGLVLFAHGSGSSRHGPRNQFVARHLTTR